MQRNQATSENISIEPPRVQVDNVSETKKDSTRNGGEAQLTENNTPTSSICGFDVGLDRRVSFSTVSAGSDIEEALLSLSTSNDVTSSAISKKSHKEKRKSNKRKHKNRKSKHSNEQLTSIKSKRHVIDSNSEDDIANNYSSGELDCKRSRIVETEDEKDGDETKSDVGETQSKLDQDGIPYFERLLESEYTLVT